MSEFTFKDYDDMIAYLKAKKTDFTEFTELDNGMTMVSGKSGFIMVNSAELDKLVKEKTKNYVRQT